MGRLDVDFIRWTDNSSATWEVPVEELRTRVIQYYTAQYTGGDWNPNNSYNWIPGAYTNFTPRRSNSRINFKMRLPMAWVVASHAIQNFIFYANGVNYWAWSETGTHHENGKTYQFEVPSWGAGATAAIGIQSRSHADDNHEQRMYRTYYWNGGGSVQNCYGQLFIEERMS